MSYRSSSPLNSENNQPRFEGILDMPMYSVRELIQALWGAPSPHQMMFVNIFELSSIKDGTAMCQCREIEV